MPDWYVSSAAWTAIAQFVASHAYSVGNIVRPLTAPAATAQYAFRCTTAGTSSTEPAWPTGNNSTVTTGGATFTNVSAQSTYGWSAAAGSLPSISYTGPNRLAIGDRVFISSDHNESTANATLGNNFNSTFGLVQFICVNRAGSVPPVAADVTTGASITATGGINLYPGSDLYYQGITHVVTSGGINLLSYHKTATFVNCLLNLNSGGTNFIGFNGSVGKLVLDNTKVQFNAAGQSVNTTNGTAAPELVWQNTPSAISGTAPTVLFPNSWNMNVTCRGVDLSAVTGTLVSGGSNTGAAYLFDSCRIASAVTRYGTPSTVCTRDTVELVNCYDGTTANISERYTPFGTLTTNRSTTMVGGAQDDVGLFSHQMGSNANGTLFGTLDSFWMDVEQSAVGTSHTATVEIVSSATLNTTDISLQLEYLGTSGSSLATFGNSLPNALTASAALPTSTAVWNSPPTTPQAQRLQVTFTPQTAGRLRGIVRLGKPSTTVFVNPQITVT